MDVGIFDQLGIEDITGRGQLTQVKVGRHDGVRGVSPGGVCVLSIKLTESSRVDVSSSARADEQKACQVANQVAELVEPKLP